MKQTTRRIVSIFLVIMLFPVCIHCGETAGVSIATKEYEAGQKVPIVVEAPLETEKITAVITTVRKIDLVYDEESNRWVGEWVVPGGTDPGEHAFKIIAVDFEGYVTEAQTDKFIVIRKATTEEIQKAKASEEVGMGGPIEVLPLPVAPKVAEEAPVAEEKVEAVKEEVPEEAMLPMVEEKPETVEEEVPEAAMEEPPVVEKKPEAVIKAVPEAAKEEPPVVEEKVAAVKEAPKVAIAEAPARFPTVTYERSPGKIISTHNLLSKFQTFVKTLVVTGVVGKDIKQVRINDEVVQVDKEGRFAANIPMNYGKNLIRFEVETYDGEIISKQSKMLRLVAQVHEFDYQTREQLFEEMTQEKRLGLTLFGIYLERYVDLAGKINRAEAAKIIAKLYDYEIKPVSGNVFPDVPADDGFAPYMQACKTRKVFIGFPDGKFRPRELFSIAEFAAVLCDVEKLLAKGNRVSDQGFWAKDNIAAVKEGGYIKFPQVSYDSYYRQPVMIDWMVEALNRTDKMKEKQSQLLDWEQGYNK